MKRVTKPNVGNKKTKENNISRSIDEIVLNIMTILIILLCADLIFFVLDRDQVINLARSYLSLRVSMIIGLSAITVALITFIKKNSEATFKAEIRKVIYFIISALMLGVLVHLFSFSAEQPIALPNGYDVGLLAFKILLVSDTLVFIGTVFACYSLARQILK